MFDSQTIHNPVKDGACITPTIYDPKTFEPKRKICIEFSPEVKQDIIDGDNKKTQELIELFTRVIKNPEEYRIKGIRSFLIRGIFDEIQLNDKIHKEDIGELNLNYENQKHFPVCYLESVPDVNNNITLNLRKKYLPNSLKEKFMKTFIDNKLINEETLNKFLEENVD